MPDGGGPGSGVEDEVDGGLVGDEFFAFLLDGGGPGLGIPDASAFTRRWYARLPELYRDPDPAADWSLLRYLSLIGDLAGEVETLLDRIDYVSEADGGGPADTSSLVDPIAADLPWLRWAGQLVGVARSADLAGDELRAAIASASSGWQAGTKASIAAAVRPVLTGGQEVGVYDHYDDDPWKIEVRVRVSESPGDAGVLAAIARARAKPAGAEIVVTAHNSTWDVLEAVRPTWADWDGNTWTQIEESD